ncbi:N-carbamoylputrescine amidase [Francisella tularensis subsp. novicida]|uniref:N-carbamoylputrescine amidase n=1 Tax=Francisella tularensis TaxID=263 RepID=UPI000CE2A1CA|nr:N-carbamoylputrescine amidase [Francisella tularensis]AVC44718.1 N-carbamoylputrescine amidase [Francisella tularensis subsp. novicida]
MANIKVAVVQLSFNDNEAENLAKLESKIIQAAKNGAKIILTPELPSYLYFCKKQNSKYFDLAKTIDESPIVKLYKLLAHKYNIVLPASFFERDGNACYNSIAMIDADGSIMGVYRKAHIPDGIGYQEKYYFSPGSAGFKVWDTKYAKVGVGICWDQWFPEAARVMALKGAEILLYPTAIGSEPHLPDYDSKDHWQRVMQGHAAANMLPVLASNRYATEANDDITATYYGSSFITDHTGDKIAEANRSGDDILYATFDFAELQQQRFYWGLFRDRRPELYNEIVRKY